MADTEPRYSTSEFGASTGGGAALVAPAERPEVVQAIVSRGGRPNLAGSTLPHVKAPTFLHKFLIFFL